MRTIPAVALALSLAACGAPADEPAVDAASAPEAPAAGGVTDPQIADIVVAANEVDVRAGELARERATDPRVREFAERMITDHTGVNRAAGELVGRLGVTPEPSPTSQQLRRDGELAREGLSRESGAGFDRAYLEQEVAYHQTVLEAIDQTLIPSAQNAELRQLLEQTRPAVEAHLEHARQLERELGEG